MSQDRVRHELEQLTRANQVLQEHVERLQSGARFAKSPERLASFVLEVQATRKHIEFAVEPPPEVLAASDPQAPLGGWLRRRLSKMAQSIAAGEEPQAAEGEAPEAVRRDEPPARPVGGFHGDSWAISLPGLLGFLETQRKSGQLKVQLPDEEATLEFDEGLLVLAVSNHMPPEERLGELLVRQGAVQKERLEAFLLCFRSSTRRLGEALLQGELVSQDALCDALDLQAQLLFQRLISTPGLQYVFREGSPDLSRAGPRLKITRLLLESARLLDESGGSADFAA